MPAAVPHAVPDDVPDAALRSALQFAVTLATAGARSRPPMAFPSALRPLMKHARLPNSALATVRRAVEGDDSFRGAVAAAATSDLVDEVGLLWLQRPDGWQAQVVAMAGADMNDTADTGAGARREQKRREAAEAALAKAQRELLEVRRALDGERAALRAATADCDRLSTELEAALARQRELESTATRRAKGTQRDAARVDELTIELDRLRAELAQTQAARDAALAHQAAEQSPVDVDRLRHLLADAMAVVGTPRRHQRRRSPLPIPGGVYGDSEAAAEYLLRAEGVTVLVDGYNVAMLGWPSLRLSQQRDRCVEGAERLAQRWGCAIHVVFDGSHVVGAHTSARRYVKVSFSPDGVLADDVLRDEVRALDVARPVVVVTNDQEVLGDVRAMGANTVSSDTFVALVRR